MIGRSSQSLWISFGAAFLFIRMRGIGPELVWWDNLKTRLSPKPKFTIVPKENVRRVVEPDDIYASVDPILDKIAKSGIGQFDRGRNGAHSIARAIVC